MGDVTYILDWLPDGGVLWGCHNCNWSYRSDNDEPVIHKCGEATPRKLGEAIETFLASYGVTQQWWCEFKGRRGWPPACACPARVEWFNELSDELPFGLGHLAARLLEYLTRETSYG